LKGRLGKYSKPESGKAGGTRSTGRIS
jgi:hypothetical protein